MTDTSILSLILSIFLGGTTVYLCLIGMIMIGLLVFSLLILLDVVLSNKEITVQC